MKHKTKKRLYWVGGIFLFLLLLHILFPILLLRYVNKSLENIPDHTGSVDDIHTNLFRGAYVIHGLQITKEEGDVDEPFVVVPQIDLSLEWNAIFDGEIVGEITFKNPAVNFVVPSQDSAATKQTGEQVDWSKPLKDMMPLTINRLEVINGNIHYKDPSSDPTVDIHLEQLNAVVTDLSNTQEKQDKLPSELKLSAISIGNGKLNVKGGLNIIQKVPDFDINLSFEDVDLTALNDFAKAYAKADIESGTLNFYTEFKGNDGDLQGYVKPLFKNMKFVDWSKEEKNPLEFAWEAIIGSIAEIFENQKKEQFGTRIPIEGNYENIRAGIFPAIGNVLRNAFIQAFEGNTEGRVQFNADAGKAEGQN